MEQGQALWLVAPFNPSPVYDDEYVGRLAIDFYQHHPESDGHVFHAVEDDRWPNYWCKMAAFEYIASKTHGCYLADLDTIIIGRLPRPVHDQRLTTVHDFYRAEPQLQMGFAWVPADVAGLIMERFLEDPDGIMRRFRGDGEFVRSIGLRWDAWRDVAPGQVVSFKIHCQNEVPEGARVICYHGKPRPRDTGWAVGGAARFFKNPSDRYLSP